MLILRQNECIRLYLANGQHRASLVACGIDASGKVCTVDLATPDGKVKFCGVNLDLVDCFLELFGSEEF